MPDEEFFPTGTVIDEDEELPPKPEESPSVARIQWQAIRNRRGRFTLSFEIIEKIPERAMEIFSKMIILTAESSDSSWTINYQAISPLFDEIQPGTSLPWYCLYVGNDNVLKTARIFPGNPPEQEEQG